MGKFGTCEIDYARLQKRKEISKEQLLDKDLLQMKVTLCTTSAGY